MPAAEAQLHTLPPEVLRALLVHLHDAAARDAAAAAAARDRQVHPPAAAADGAADADTDADTDADSADKKTRDAAAVAPGPRDVVLWFPAGARAVVAVGATCRALARAVARCGAWEALAERHFVRPTFAGVVGLDSSSSSSSASSSSAAAAAAVDSGTGGSDVAAGAAAGVEVCVPGFYQHRQMTYDGMSREMLLAQIAGASREASEAYAAQRLRESEQKAQPEKVAAAAAAAIGPDGEDAGAGSAALGGVPWCYRRWVEPGWRFGAAVLDRGPRVVVERGRRRALALPVQSKGARSWEGIILRPAFSAPGGNPEGAEGIEPLAIWQPHRPTAAECRADARRMEEVTAKAAQALEEARGELEDAEKKAAAAAASSGEGEDGAGDGSSGDVEAARSKVAECEATLAAANEAKPLLPEPQFGPPPFEENGEGGLETADSEDYQAKLAWGRRGVTYFEVKFLPPLPGTPPGYDANSTHMGSTVRVGYCAGSSDDDVAVSGTDTPSRMDSRQVWVDNVGSFTRSAGCNFSTGDRVGILHDAERHIFALYRNGRCIHRGRKESIGVDRAQPAIHFCTPSRVRLAVCTSANVLFGCSTLATIDDEKEEEEEETAGQ